MSITNILNEQPKVVEGDGDSSEDSYYGNDDNGYVMSSDDNNEDHLGDKEVTEKPRIKKVASVMSDILASNEEGPVILSKSKRKKDIVLSIADAEREKELKEKRAEKLYKKRLRLTLGREIPSIEQDYEKERKLRIIGTQGVVQLFSTIEKHRKVMKGKLMVARTEHEREKVLAGTKDSFTNLLENERDKVKIKGFTKMELKDEFDEPKKLKSAAKSEWHVFAKDYYNEPVMSGWDKEDSDDG